MKRLHLFFLASLFANSLDAQVQQKLNIDEATVFLSGAELTSRAKVNLQKGENEVLFSNVAGDVNAQSISVSVGNGVVVEAATFQNNYLATEVVSPKFKELKDSAELLTETRQQISNRITVLNEQIAILQENRKVSGNANGLSTAELMKMLDLINSKMEGILNQKSKQETLQKKMDERIVKLTKQLEEEQRRGYQPGGQILVKFYAQEATASEVVIDYVVPTAGWTPTYDIRVADVHSPAKLYYKANIYQNTGVKWNNVRLTLSTGNPNEGGQSPVINPWYLAFYVPANAPGPVVMAYRKPLVSQSAEDMQPFRGGTFQKSAESSINQYVSVDNAGINTSFDIELPYSIPSDGQQHLVAIKEYALPATYAYYAVPKLDKDAFLQAHITNWEDLNLLPGQSNIFYEGTYVGQGYIDVRNVKDTMDISLGRDKKIIVKRERDTKLRSVKTIGTNVRETFAYTITVRNTRKENINLLLEDQQPVSNDKDIQIEDKDTGGADYNETTGAMKWTLNVNANEAKKVGFGYTIKYPKGRTVGGLK